MAFFRSTYWLVLLLLMFTTQAAGQSPQIPITQLGNDRDTYPIEKVLLLVDSSGTLTFDQIREESVENQFKLIETTQQLPEGVNTFWLKLAVINTLDFDNDWIINFWNWTVVDVYQQSGESLQHFQTGHLIPYNARDTPNGNESLVTIKVRSDVTTLLWVRLHRKRDGNFIPTNFALDIHEEQSLLQQKSTGERVISIFLAIFMVMFLYHLVVYFSTGNKLYLYYLFLLGCQMYMSAHNSGYIIAILSFIEDFPSYRMLVEGFAVSALGIAGMLFARNFLSFKSRYPRWYKTYTILIIWSLVLPIIYVVQLDLGSMLINLTSLFIVVTILMLGIRSLRAGYPTAGIFVLAFSFSLAGSITLILSVMKVIPMNNFNFLYAMPLGAAIQMILFAFALGATIREKERTDIVLRNVFPEDTADQLKKTGHANARHYDQVSIMFIDVVEFTKISEKMDPGALVVELESFFQNLDRITDRFRVEKIKTIGDAYLCAGGLPTPNMTHPQDTVIAALEVLRFLEKWNDEKGKAGVPEWHVRIGIHTGPVTSGVVGERKLAFDIWGDAVNVAQRMEQSGETNKINISEQTFNLIKNEFRCTSRGKILAKNKGEIEMYFVEEIIAKESQLGEAR